jgi:hypothetical protein
MLPFEPELEEQIMARFPAALAEIQDAAAIERDPTLRPSSKRKHVFDFPNGIRLCASRDQVDGHVITHFSFSLSNHFVSIWTPDRLLTWISDLSRRLGQTRRPDSAMMTRKGVIHYQWDENPVPRAAV